MTFHLNANDFYVYNVSDIIDIVETKPYNTILNYGFHIFSTAPVSIYYESANLNSEIYSLKGSNALGKNFIIAMQQTYNNYAYENYSTCSRIEVVATDDDTSINIVPSKPIKGGGQSGVPITIILNRGQTYAIEANSPLGINHLYNTRITSDKPIAVNATDDSVWTGGASWDLVGDQIVPVNLLGTDYLALWNNTSNEYLYFIPTQNNTRIYLDGNQTPTVTLDINQDYAYHLNTPVAYVHSDKPISVFQLTSDEIGELGGTVLPHINCTGSRKVVYKRNGTMDIIVTIVAKSNCVNDFLVNGNSNYLTSSDFNVVPSNVQYSYCNKNVSQYIPTNGLLQVENTNEDGYFQLGVFSKGSGSGTCSYGYFSNYNKYAYANFNMDDTYCSGDQISFEFVSEGVDEISLLQPNGNVITQQPFILENVQSSQSGRYSLLGLICDEAQELDYIDIKIGSMDTTELIINTCEPYLWNGITYDIPGVYEQSFINNDGCDSIAQLSLNFYEHYDIEIDTLSCSPIEWYSEILAESGIYSKHFISMNGCDSLVTLNVTIGISSNYSIYGKSIIFPSTDITSGQYSYFIDSTGIDPSNVHWDIDREDWLLVPHGASCNLVCMSEGQAVLHAWTEGELCDVDTTMVLNATFYSIGESNTQSASVYPNPTSGKVTIIWQDIVAIKVFNLLGQKVDEYKFEKQDKVELDLQDYQEAVCVLEISTLDRKAYKSVVLTK